jgi:hypothetical protein
VLNLEVPMHVYQSLAGAVRVGLLCLLATGAWGASTAAPTPAPSSAAATPDPAAPKAAAASKGTLDAPSLAATLGAVQEISRELKRIDERLGALERSVAGVDASLKPVAALTQPDALQAAVVRAADVLFERARALILLVALCVAALLVLHALLRRWNQAQAAVPNFK